MSTLRRVGVFTYAFGWTAFMTSLGLVHHALTKDRVAFRRATRFWAAGLAYGYGMRVSTHGAELLDPHENYVFMANHLSHVDIIALLLALPADLGFVAKAELRGIPLLGSAMTAGGHVFVDRARHRRATEALMSAAESVKLGASLVIFPEGTRGQREVVQRFKSGGFRLACQGAARIVPLGIRGSLHVLREKPAGSAPCEVQVHIGTPIDPHSVSDLTGLIQRVRLEVARLAGMPLAR